MILIFRKCMTHIYILSATEKMKSSFGARRKIFKLRKTKFAEKEKERFSKLKTLNSAESL
ncbi:hypothetical protein A2935_03930 [Candidatus Wolfebacteria bacterium RIFCSPLOWO2_01_FULL_47_17b]|uniref:Uncharacterized protein n=1 Tax=Candidatus Wolfebacteria bacterium RIFCSPLOWO2_01_FULL_47_17b TaxID=1802558 RepID=A0A1F8DY94_9BACT|nr:MAG: hypothetical protein A2935_03930 [Candidatus Wolfebacteria bacterium RIFCSPLOWO2_01_FULL_47_17b]